jgi:rod shape-determining protein MreD
MFIDQFHLPYGGFSLFLIFTLCWSAMSVPEVGAISGFGAGLMLDLSPSSTAPVGQWMLVMSAVGFGIAFLRYGDDSLRSSPLSLIVLVSAGVVVSIAAYAVLSLLLGKEMGDSTRLAINIFGNGLWSLAVTPFILPIASRLHRSVFESREML